MQNMTYEYRCLTKSGPKTVYIMICETAIEVLRNHVAPDVITKLCRDGCINFNKKWSCPPHAEKFDILSKPFSRAIITCMYIYTDEFCYVQNKYLRIKAANMVLKKLSNHLAREAEQTLGAYALLNGSCTLCRPCECKKGLPCKRPEQLRYSMEATGINVASLLQAVFGFELQWYSRDFMPLYTSVASCVLYNNTCRVDDAHFTNKSFANFLLNMLP